MCQMGVNPHLTQVLKVGNTSHVDVTYPLIHSKGKGITALCSSPGPGTHDVRKHQISPKGQATDYVTGTLQNCQGHEKQEKK